MSASIASRFLCVFILSSLYGSESSAKGSGLTREDPYNPQHIESLPPEIRKAVIHQCGTPKALHYFATYTENLQRVVLHFEHFYCGSGDAFCSSSGCLHQIYVFSRGNYRLLRSYYSRAGH